MIEQFHQNGYARTSLVDVAKGRGPVGRKNVFYYFKAKDDLARAVIEEWCSLSLPDISPSLRSRPATPGGVSMLLSNKPTDQRMDVTLGCPLAGLTRDLRQESEALKAAVAKIYSVQFRWLTEQLRRAGMSMGVAKENACALMAGYHGSILLAYAQNDPFFIEGEVKRLKKWLREIRVLLERTS